MGNKVLIIDDDEKLRKLLKEYLEGNGFKVLTLADGSDVKKTLRKESPEIVILDIGAVSKGQDLEPIPLKIFLEKLTELFIVIYD